MAQLLPKALLPITHITPFIFCSVLLQCENALIRTSLVPCTALAMLVVIVVPSFWDVLGCFGVVFGLSWPH